MVKRARRPKSRGEDPWTSHKAEEDADLTFLEDACYKAVLTAPITGLTTWEICWITGLEYGSVTPRMVDLEDHDLVERRFGEDGKELTRIPKGRKRAGIIWWPKQRKEEVHVEPDNRRGPRLGDVAAPAQRPPEQLPLFRIYNEKP